MKIRPANAPRLAFAVTAALLLAAPVFGLAQAERNVTFRAISCRGAIDDLAYANGGELERFSVDSGGFSETLRYRGPPKLRFYRLPPRIEDDARALGERIPDTPAAAYDLSPEADHFLIVFLTGFGGDESDGIRVLGVPADLPDFPPEYVKIWNFTEDPVALALDDSRHELGPRESKLLYEKAEGPGDDAAEIAFGRALDVRMAARSGDAWRQIYRSRWSISGQNRLLVFVYPFPGSERPRIKTITEFLPEERAESRTSD